MNIYVGNLSYEVGEDDLREAFEAHGEVASASVISDKFTGRSRGFGFVTYTTEESARNAMDALKDTELDGRTIRVDFANDRR